MSVASPVAYVDTHTHLDDPAFDPDRNEVIRAALAAGVGAMVNVGYRRNRWERSIALADRYPEVSVMLGIHPQHADQFGSGSEEALIAALGRSRAVALGEAGLDYYRDGPDPATQRRAFRAQLELGAALNLPVVIHQRAAEEDLMRVLSATDRLPRLVLHSFDGTRRLACFALERAAVLGVGGLATRTASTALRTVLSEVPPTSIVLETDAPYLIPAGVRGRRNEPANVPRIATRLAPIWDVSADGLATITTATAAGVFALDYPPDPASKETEACALGDQ